MHTRTGVRWVTPHSTDINIQTCSLFLSLHASTGKEDTIDNKIQKNPNNIRQDELEAPWRTCSGGLVKNKRKKNFKKEGKEPLYPLYGPIREGKGFWVTPCRMGEGEGSSFACRWGMSQSPWAYMSVTKWWGENKNSRSKGGKGFIEKKWLARKVDVGFLSVKDYQPHLSCYWFSFDVYGSKGNRHGANPN